ncbi:MAG: sigma 54-interacting transcriptional regulator [Proteobacteria bacterium]|nr:sigma 54-interacting transcriptional regulator [Pseudomonadota bacterium]
MMINENHFFREATLHICGSVEIEKALSACYNYLSSILFIDYIYLHFIELEQKRGTVFAMADRHGGRRKNIRFDHPAKIWDFIGDGTQIPEKRLLNRADQDPLGKQMLQVIGIQEKISIMTLRLSLDNREVGVVGFGAKGWDRFTKEDLGLLGLLTTPFAIAFSNCRRYLELLELKNRFADDAVYLQNELRSQNSHEVVGADFGLHQVMQQVRQVASRSSSVLLLGETGVGKEVIANALHNSSQRRKGPFIKVNCGAIPETLIDSELFGHERGAFTGALEKRRGRFERAHGGTIFLDEIGELPIPAQIRLLRVLQEMEFEPVGASQSIKVDIRVIAATNRDLETLIEEGRFRRDLYFRLMVFPIQIPPLRERKCDIPALIQHFILKNFRASEDEDYPTLASGALKKLTSYDWPGNVRELENAVEREMIISRGKLLQFYDLGTAIHRPRPEAVFITNHSQLRLNDVLANHIKRVLDIAKGKVSGPDGAAELLDVNPATLRHRMKKLNIAFGRGVNPI